MSKLHYACSQFEKGFSCSQSVFSSFAQDLGLDLEVALKISEAFGGGIAGTAHTCGAVTGALMAISLKYGRIDSEDKDAWAKTRELAQFFLKEFESNNGTVLCKELLGYDLSTEEGLKALNEKGLFKSRCPEFISNSVKILEEML
jgi:C_GCAxxG_C_C family probable redox protein